MKKRGNQTRKGRRQKTKKRRVQVRQRKSRKMVGGVNFFSRMMGRKDAKIFPSVKPRVTISSRKPGETYHVFTPKQNKYTSDLEKNFRQGLPFGYDPLLDPDGSRLKELQEDENERLKQILDEPVHKHSEFSEMQDPELTQINSNKARQEVLNSSIAKHVTPFDYYSIYKNIHSKKFSQENPMRK